MKYIHSSNHRITFGKFLRKSYKTFVNGLNDRSVRPINTELSACFVVGCGHSGTTLTAAKLGNHSDAFLIGRETHNYAPARGLYSSWRVTQEWLAIVQSINKKLLVEKTPKHVHAIPRIRQILPDAKFLAMTRNPLDNCFSLYQRYGNLDFAIERWNMDNAVICDLLEDDKVKVVDYESLTAYPEESFKEICLFLEVTWQPEILDEGVTAYDRFQNNDNMKVRQEQVKNSIRPSHSKWKNGFSSSQVELVYQKTRSIAEKLGYSRT